MTKLEINPELDQWNSVPSASCQASSTCVDGAEDIEFAPSSDYTLRESGN